MNQYQPNFNDPRVISRAKAAIAFVESCVFDQPVPVAKTQIVKYMGQLQTPLAKYLKEQLLTCVDPYFNWETSVCKKYVRNTDGVAALRRAVGLTSASISQHLQDQLITGNFVMTEKSDRFHNPIQYIPRRIRDDLLNNHGYRHNYDIECAAATLLYQYAKKISAETGVWLELDHIELYIADRTAVRNQLATQYNISESVIKGVLTAVFQGGQLSLNHRTRIFHLLNGNYNLIRTLKSNDYIAGLLADIKTMWKVIGEDLKTQLNKNKLNGRDKAALYRKLEREVMTIIKRQLRKSKIKFFEIHDGWACDTACDINHLIACVRKSTGYVIKLDWEIWSSCGD
jgi:hypothetical protein